MAKAKEQNNKHSGGRPTKFKPEYIKSLIEFFSIEPYKKEVTESSKEFFQNGAVKKESVKYRLTPSKMPTLYSFSRKIGVAYSTVWRWAEKGNDEELETIIDKQMSTGKTDVEALEIAHGIKEFCNAYKEAKELQKEFLISIGLSGAAPSPAFIFTAKNVTDMRDKQEVESKTDLHVTGFEKLDDEQLDAVIEQLKTQVGGSVAREGKPKGE
jgi:hypothetical protein